MPVPLIIAGAGGHGREVLDVVRSAIASGLCDYEFLGFVDDGHPNASVLARIGARLLGGVDWGDNAPDGTQFLVGIGDPAARRTVGQLLTRAGLAVGSVRHATAVTGADVEFGEGAVICANTTITTNVRAGEHCHININATISHDVVLGDRVTLSPGVHLAGNVVLGDDVTLGIGACVLPGVRIGAGALVGAGAAVIADVPSGATVKGVPARR